MAREKKITVKIIANSALSFQLNDEGDKEYPLYAQVTYDRKTTKFPLAGELWATEEDVNEYYSSGYPKDEVQQIAEFEKERSLDFSVRGFADIYKVYTSSFHLATEFYLMDIVDREAQKVVTVSRYRELNPNGIFDYRRGLEILDLQTTDEIRETLEVYDTLLRMRVDLTVLGWIIPGSDRENAIKILEASCDVPSLKISQLDKIAFRLIDTHTYTP